MMAILQLIYDPLHNIRINPDAGQTHSIAGFKETLTFNKFDQDNGVLFDLIKDTSGKVY